MYKDVIQFNLHINTEVGCFAQETEARVRSLLKVNHGNSKRCEPETKAVSPSITLV